MAGWIDSPPSWALGIYNYGMLYNENTGWHKARQCHITVCTDNRGDNAHISIYDTNGQEISVYIPGNAWAKLFFRLNQNGDLVDKGGPGAQDIRNMPCFSLIKARAIDCFYEKFPGLRKQVLVPTTDVNAWPSL